MNIKLLSVFMLMTCLPLAAMDENNGSEGRGKPFICQMVETAKKVTHQMKKLKAMATRNPKACCFLCGLSCCCCPFVSAGTAAWRLNERYVAPAVGCVNSVRSECCGKERDEKEI